MKYKTICPYCGTTNLVDACNINHADGYGHALFQCLMCKHLFTDLALDQELQEQKKQQEQESQTI